MKINGKKGLRIVLLFLILALSSVTVFSSLASEVSQKITVTLEFGEKHASFAELFYEKINSDEYPFTLDGTKITFQIESGKKVREINSYIDEAAQKKNNNTSLNFTQNEEIDNGELYFYTDGLFHLKPLSEYTEDTGTTELETRVTGDIILYAHWAMPTGSVSVEIVP